ncbi:MAG: hypothetical protein QMC34_07630 [Flavobacteriales bacterium]|jgi:hypothetical protein|tara:strand:- start:50 stop:475 length:426 start_codon:yes stop_codon:yes gene_type:complete
MLKVYQHTTFSKISKTLVFGIALCALLKFLFFDSLFDKTSLALGVILTIMFVFLSILIFYILLDVWMEKIIISHNGIIYHGVFGKKEILDSNVKGFITDGEHISIYSKDNSIILSFDKRLKHDEKIAVYLENQFECLNEKK